MTHRESAADKRARKFQLTLAMPLKKVEVVRREPTQPQRVDPDKEALMRRLQNDPRHKERARQLNISVDQLLHIYSLDEKKSDHIIYMLEHGTSYEVALQDAETLVLLDNK